METTKFESYLEERVALMSPSPVIGWKDNRPIIDYSRENALKVLSLWIRLEKC